MGGLIYLFIKKLRLPSNRRDVLKATATAGLGVTGVGDAAASTQNNGRRQWSFATGQKITASPTVVGGTVYVGSWDGNVYAVDVADGTEKWRYEYDGPVRYAVNVVDGSLYLAVKLRSGSNDKKESDGQN